MTRQYEKRGGALVLVEYYNDDDPEKGEAEMTMEPNGAEIREPEKLKE
jgi:hypothetical protein